MQVSSACLSDIQKKVIVALVVTQACPGRIRLNPEMLWLLFVHITRVQLTLPFMRKMQNELTVIVLSHYFTNILDSSFPKCTYLHRNLDILAINQPGCFE